MIGKTSATKSLMEISLLLVIRFKLYFMRYIYHYYILLFFLDG